MQGVFDPVRLAIPERHSCRSRRIATMLGARTDKTRNGASAPHRRSGPRLEPRTERPLVVPERLSRRHAAAHAARSRHRFPARRSIERDEPLRRGQDRLDARRGPDLGDPRVRHVPHPVAAGCARHDHPREQLHAVDRDGGGLHDDAAHLRACGLHVGDQRRAALVADHVLQRRAVLDGRAGRVSDEAPVHQRRAASVSGGPGLRSRARCTVRNGGREVRDVQGQGAGRRGRHRGLGRRPLRREHHAARAAEVAGARSPRGTCRSRSTAGTTPWRTRASHRCRDSRASTSGNSRSRLRSTSR